jgi:cytochrome c-type biogenesis protein CcmH/NrfG
MSGNLSDIAGIGNDLVQSYVDALDNELQSQTTSIREIDTKNTQLLEKQKIQLNQLQEIQEKEKLLLTRSRMLQISQDRNSYKKKVIYSLIAVVFAIFILSLVMYVLFTRKAGMQK